MYRVTYFDSGLRRHTKTMDETTKEWYCSAWYVGIRVTSYRKI